MSDTAARWSYTANKSYNVMIKIVPSFFTTNKIAEENLKLMQF